jgi:hypothetical protein
MWPLGSAGIQERGSAHARAMGDAWDQTPLPTALAVQAAVLVGRSMAVRVAAAHHGQGS